VLDLVDAVVARPQVVRDLALRLAAPRLPWQVRIVCPRLAARRALLEVIGSAPIAVVATVDDAVADLTLASA
jgi:hypothetical protein